MSFYDPYIGYANTDSARTNEIRGDDFHFNEAGQKKIARTSLQALQSIPNNYNRMTWNMRGNDSTTVRDFIGTLRDFPLNFKINNIFSGILSSTNTGFGYNGTISSTGGTYFGGYSRVGIDATAIGFNANADFDYGIAIGNGSTARSKAVGVGTYSNLQADATGVGYFMRLGTGATGLGHYIEALGTNSVGIGKYANPQGDNVITFPVAGENFATVTPNMGLGTSSPTSRLHVVGDLRLVNGTQGAGKVLTSDANGNATWQAPAGGGLATADFIYNEEFTGSATLAITIANTAIANKYNVYKNGVLLPLSQYTVSGTTLTLVSRDSADDISITYIK
jgi:hypothetical protein